jgi:WS/DGAT/MGAT family acyltransferase
MSSVDTAWLRMDSPGNLMMIVGVAMLDRPVGNDALKGELTQHILTYRRFRSRVVSDYAGSWWQEQVVDLDDHVIRIALPALKKGQRDNKAALQALVGQLAGEPLNPEKPLWQMHLVDHCIGVDGNKRQALIIRIHHCIADGVALVRLFMSMFGALSATHAAFAPEEMKHPAHDDLHAQLYDELHAENHWQQLLEPVTHGTIKAIEASSAVLQKSLEALGEVEALGEHVLEWGQVCAKVAHDALAIGTMREDSHTRLKGKPGGKKCVAWSEPMPLAEVKLIAKAWGCSINDILLSSVAGAVRSYLLYKGDVVPADCEMRAMVPVNLRKPSEAQKLGNEFGLVPLVLPIGVEDPVARLREVQKRMTELKGSYTALVAMSMLGVLGSAPKVMQTEIQDYFARKASAVITNVPGPQSALSMAGASMDQVMFWVPQSGDIGVGISILSYNGGVQFGIVTDSALADDPDQIISRFAPEFEKLVWLMLMDGDW